VGKVPAGEVKELVSAIIKAKNKLSTQYSFYRRIVLLETKELRASSF